MCHGPAGRGDAGAVLAGHEQLADVDFVATAVVHGFGYVPAFRTSSATTMIAEIATAIRNNWGNDFGVLTKWQVRNAR